MALTPAGCITAAGTVAGVGNAGFGSVGHLAGRFAGSLRPGGPGVGDEAWARHWLLPGERILWDGMDGADRRHAVAVARATAVRLGDADGTGVPRAVLAAALLHDVGKLHAGLGTWGRVGATVVAVTLGRERVAAWSPRPAGWRGKVGRYVRHDTLGAALLRHAGSDPLTAAWARQHHLPFDRWTLPVDVAAALHSADGD